MKTIKEMSLEELAAFISANLRKNNIEVILTGGSCVSIYSENKYVSMDLDFVETFYTKRKDLVKCLIGLGFYEENRYFKHPDTDYIVEFPPGPLAVGNEPIKDIIILQFETGELRIISPTECVKDRLAAFYFWNDRQCLDQAILVTKMNDINLDEVERWSKNEGEKDKFKKFLKEL
jgi:hypothetical protein